MVRNQRLYAAALEIFASNDKIFPQVSRAYGEYLSSKKYYEEAAFIFQKAKMYQEALEAWEKSLNWRYCIGHAKDIDLEQEEYLQLCRRLAKALMEEKRYSEAGLLYAEQLKDEEEAVVAFVEGHDWAEAFRTASAYKRHDLIGRHERRTLQILTDIFFFI